MKVYPSRRTPQQYYYVPTLDTIANGEYEH